MDDLTPVQLRDGTQAFVLPLVPADRDKLRHEYEHLSPQSRFNRFLTAVPHLSDKMLVHLVDELDGAGPGRACRLVGTWSGGCRLMSVKEGPR